MIPVIPLVSYALKHVGVPSFSCATFGIPCWNGITLPWNNAVVPSACCPEASVQLRGGGLRSAFFLQFTQFPAISAIFRIFFLQFSAIFGGYCNFLPMVIFDTAIFRRVQNHNVWFKIHNFYFEHPFFLSKFMKFDHKCAKNILCWVLAWFGLVIFWHPFPCPLSGNRNFSKSRPQFLFKKSQFFRNFSAIFHNFFTNFGGSSNRNPPW